MRDRDFKEWLRRHYRTATGALLDPRSQGSTISNCRRVERAEGALDRQFAQDGLNSVLGRLAMGTTQIRVDGDRDRVFSSLKSAVTLYELFCSRWPARRPAPASPEDEGDCSPPPDVSTAVRRPRADGVAAWPTWEQPRDADLLSLAHALTPLVRFLHRDVVHAVVEDNEVHRGEWSTALDVVNAVRGLASHHVFRPRLRRLVVSGRAPRMLGRGRRRNQRRSISP